MQWQHWAPHVHPWLDVQLSVHAFVHPHTAGTAAQSCIFIAPLYSYTLRLRRSR